MQRHNTIQKEYEKRKKNNEIDLNSESRFYQYLLNRYASEIEVPPLVTKYMLLAFFLISAICYNANQNMAKMSNSFLMFLVIVGLGYFCLLELLKVSLLFNMHYRGKKKFAVKLSLYGDWGFIYIVYPLIFWSYSHLCNRPQAYSETSNFFKPGYLLLLIFLVISLLINLATLILRNTNFSRAPGCILSRITEPICYILILFSVCVIDILNGRFTVESAKPGLSIFNLVVLIMAFPLQIVYPIYWRPHLNSLYLGGYSIIILFTLNSVIQILDHGGYVKESSLYLTLLFPVFYRLYSNIFIQQEMVYFNKPGITMWWKSVGIIRMSYWLSRNFTSMSCPVERQIYQHYLGQLPEGFDESNIQEAVISKLKSIEIKDKHILNLLLTFQLLRTIPGICSLRKRIDQFRKKSTSGFISKLQHFQFVKLYENKLDLIYKGIVTRGCKATCIECLYDDYLVEKTTIVDGAEDKLDLMMIFKDAKDHKLVAKLMKRLLNSRIRIFETLMISNTVSQKEIYEINQDTYQTSNRVLKLYDDMNFGKRTHSSYIYPLFIYYFSMIRVSIKKAEFLFKIYKKKLTVFAYHSQFKDKIDNYELFGSNSCSMQVSLEKDRLGEILDITTNYFEFMGKPSHRNPIGIDINVLFPGSFGVGHIELMKTYYEYDIFHKSLRKVFINGFDGFLRDVDARVKVVPSITQTVSACGIIVFEKDKNSSLVLLEKDLSIVNAEREFWDNLDSVAGEEIISLTKISHEACIAIQLLQNFNHAEDSLKQVSQASESEYGKLLKEILRCLQELVIVNESGTNYYLNKKGRNNFTNEYMNMRIKDTGENSKTGFVKVNISLETGSGVRKKGGRKYNASAGTSSYEESSMRGDSEDSGDYGARRQEDSGQYNTNRSDELNRANLHYERKKFFRSVLMPAIQALDEFMMSNERTIDELIIAHELESSRLDVMKDCYSIWNIVESIVDYSSYLKHERNINKPKMTKCTKLLQDAKDKILFEKTVSVRKMPGELSSLSNLRNEVSGQLELSTPSLQPQNGDSNKKLNAMVYNFSTTLMRQYNRKKEATRDETNKDIVMASSNLIGRIMNKVMKRESRNRSRSVDGGSIASSLSSTRGQSVHHFLKIAEQEINPYRMLKEVVWVQFARFLFLILILCCNLILSEVTMNYISQNQVSFRTANRIVKVDFFMRRNLNLILEEVLDTWEMFKLDYYLVQEGLPLPVVLSMKPNIVHRLNTKRETLGVSSLRELLIERKRSNRVDLIESVEDFLFNSFSNSEDDILQSFLTDNIVTNNFEFAARGGVRPNSTTNALVFMRIVIERIRNKNSFYTIVTPYVDGKDPPYGLPSDIVIGWFNYFKELFAVTQNSFGGATLCFENAIEKMKEKITETQVKSFDSIQLIFSILFLLLLALYSVIVSIISVWVNRSLTSLTLLFTHLRAEELEIHPSFYKKCLDHVDRFLFHEGKLIGSYVNIGQSRSLYNDLRRSKAKGTTLKNRKMARFILDLTVTTVKVVIGSCIVTAVIFLIFFWLTLAASTEMTKSISIERFYFSNYINFIKLSDNYEAFHLMIAYGNFIRMDGRNPENAIDLKSISTFTTYWIQNFPEFEANIGSSEKGKLRSMLYDNFCQFIPPGGKFYETYTKVCNEHLPCLKGVLGFFLDQGEKLKVMTANVTQNYRAHLVASERALGEGPHVDWMLQPENIRMRMMHDVVIEILTYSLFRISDEELDNNLNSIAGRLRYYETCFIVIILLTILLTTMVARKAMVKNQAICAESSFTILPEIHYQNPYLQRALRSHFFFSK